MRILAGLTLLISVLLSSLAPAGQPELQWEYEVDPNLFQKGSRIIGYQSSNGYPRNNFAGGCVALYQCQTATGETFYALLVLRPDGSLNWSSGPRDVGASPIQINQNCLVFVEYSTRSWFSVRLDTGNTRETPVQLDILAPPELRSSGSSVVTGPDSQTFFIYTRSSSFNDDPPPKAVIQKWAIPTPTPDLAPSTFGLEDGNLIISWPTAAGQTYQVQRSTDLESWENIGVALTGNGTTTSYSQPSNADKVFLRVVIP
jgi:hypothetical protein